VNKAENLIQGRPTEIYGLMGYLLHLEKEDVKEAMSKNDNSDPTNPTLDAEVVDV
jgi:hypothetical protein